MAKITTLSKAIAELVRDGQTVAMEGFTHLIPHAAGHEVIRQGKRDLALIRMTPDVIYDQLIGMGCARKLVFSWGGNPGVGSLHRFRDAVKHGWPRRIELEEHSHAAAMASAYEAGAAGLPFAVIRGYLGSDLPKYNPRIKRIQCPFTEEELAGVPATRPDVTVIHAQQADRLGNVMIWGIAGVQKEEPCWLPKIDCYCRRDRGRLRDETQRDGPPALGGQCGLRSSGWCSPIVCARLYPEGQCFLSGVGFDRPRAREFRSVDEAARSGARRFRRLPHEPGEVEGCLRARTPLKR